MQLTENEKAIIRALTRKRIDECLMDIQTELTELPEGMPSWDNLDEDDNKYEEWNDLVNEQMAIEIREMFRE